MKLYLVRHGQSKWQIDREAGDWDSPLTGLGHQQSTRLAGWLARAPVLHGGRQLEVATLVCSPLVRAQETAVPVARSLRLPCIHDEALREADFLVSDYLPSSKAPVEAMAPYQPLPVYSSLKNRAKRALSNLIAQSEAAGGPAMGISHGGLLSTMLRVAVGSDLVSFWLYNSTVNLIEWKRGRWHLVFLNLWDHLPPELRTF
jgi:probable phosphoglycerate mutase